MRTARRPVRRPRRRHGALRRRRAGRRGDRHRPLADARDPRRRRAQPPRAAPARRHQPRGHAGGGAARALLRARSVQPAGLHDRRQRGRELGRRALPQVRLHDQPRAGGRGGARPDGERRAPRRAATSSTCWAPSSARRGRWASSPRSSCGCCRGRSAVETLLAAFARIDAAGEAVSAIIAGGHRPGGDRDDGRAHDRGRRGGGRRGAPARRGSGAAGRAGRPGRSRSSWRWPTRVRVLPRGAAPPRCAAAATEAERARVLARAQGGVRGDGADQSRTTTCRTASCRARGCPRRCAGSTSCRAQHGLRVGNVFHAGDGNLHPLVLYDGVRGRARPSAAEALARAILQRVRRGRRLAHRRARHRAGQGLPHAADVSRRRPDDDACGCARRFDPDGRLQSRQGVPHAAAVRRGAGAVPRASAGAGGGRSGGDRTRGRAT